MVKFSVKKPLTVFVAVLAVLVLGVVAYLKMTPDLLPNMDFPYVVIVTTDPGASPGGGGVRRHPAHGAVHVHAGSNQVRHLHLAGQRLHGGAGV